MIEIKKNLINLKPYKVNNKPYEVKLDANEGNNYLINQKFNLKDFKSQLYPDSDADLLRENMANYYGCSKDNIIIGNGSSELILNTINAFCNPNDRIMTFEPSFSMYGIYCKMVNCEHIKVKSKDNYGFDVKDIIDNYKEFKPKLTIICNPNNPTGSYLSKDKIKIILDNLRDTVVILDEAYIEFGGESAVNLIDEYENLIVMRTLSKAFGLAGLRIGSAISNKEMINNLWKIKLPYNLSSISQLIANQAFENLGLINEHIKSIISERKRIGKALKEENVTVYPSKTNFIMIKSPIENLQEKLQAKGVLIRDITADIKDHYRITIGSKDENNFLLKKLKEVNDEENKGK